MAQSNKPRQGKRTPAYSADNMIAYMVLGLILIAMGVLIFLATTGIMGGTLFEGLKGLCQSIAGLLSIPFAAIPVWGGILALISTQKKPPLRAFLISLLLFVLVATAISSMVRSAKESSAFSPS